MSIYKEIIKNPDKKYRGQTRWWWYGCAVTKEEIEKELNYMNDNYIGGVEIQILYPLSMDDTNNNIKNIQYFSPEFFDVINFTCKIAKQLGMTVDFTLGSSWPFGGSFVPKEMSAPCVMPYMIDVTGPCNFSYDFTTQICGEVVGCVIGKMEKSVMVTNEDIHDKITNKSLFNWPWGVCIENLEIPEGDYKIILLVSNKYRENVLAPTFNAEGYVIDHNRKDAADCFFDNMLDPLVEKLGKGTINSFFCDSIELGGNNWTNIIYPEFKKRRKYDLTPYIYALWGNLGNITERIRYDFHLTMSELTIENFFQVMTNRCNKLGSKSRIQAHGTWADAMKAYASADIPEGETFSALDTLMVNTVHRKIASSAGHIYNKPIISNESFTWLRFPRFTETLEQIKAAVDCIFLDGINNIINHGYSYSPENTGEIGWPFYASSHISHTNTWWKYYKHVGKYINSVSEFLQMGENYAEVLIYLPQHDIWAEQPLCDLHMTMKLAEKLTDKAVNDISRAGYWFDYINDEGLQLCQLEDGQLINGVNKYKVLILISTTIIPVETAERIKEFVNNGGIVICCEKAPEKSGGFINMESNDLQVKGIMNSIFTETINSIASVGKGKSVLVSDRYDQLTATLESLIKPDLKITNGYKEIGYVHRKLEDKDIYFVSNTSCNSIIDSLIFKNQDANFEIYEPLNGNRIYPIEAKKGENLTIILEFEPFESFIIIFDKSLEENKKFFAKQKAKDTIDISNDWSFMIEGIRGRNEYSILESWEKEEEYKYFSGTGIYKKKFTLQSTDFNTATLEIENLGEVCEVWVNGNLMGDIIKKPYSIGINNLVLGENEIIIKVTNLLINKVINPELQQVKYAEKVTADYPYFTEGINAIRSKRLFNWREIDMIKQPFKSGIWGNIKINLY